MQVGITDLEQKAAQQWKKEEIQRIKQEIKGHTLDRRLELETLKQQLGKAYKLKKYTGAKKSE